MVLEVNYKNAIYLRMSIVGDSWSNFEIQSNLNEAEFRTLILNYGIQSKCLITITFIFATKHTDRVLLEFLNLLEVSVVISQYRTKVFSPIVIHMMSMNCTNTKLLLRLCVIKYFLRLLQINSLIVESWYQLSNN